MKSIDDRHSFSTADYLPRCLEGMFLGSRPRLLLVFTFAASVIASASREARHKLPVVHVLGHSLRVNEVPGSPQCFWFRRGRRRRGWIA